MNDAEKIKGQSLITELEQQRNMMGNRACEIAGESAVEIAKLRTRIAELESLLASRKPKKQAHPVPSSIPDLKVAS